MILEERKYRNGIFTELCLTLSLNSKFAGSTASDKRILYESPQIQVQSCIKK